VENGRAASLKLVSFVTPQGLSSVGEWTENGIRDLSRGEGDLGRFLERGVRLEELSRRDGPLYDRSDVQLLPPIPNPSKVIAIGLNYADHAREQGKEPPDHPVLFSKAPSCLLGHGGTIVLPRGCEQIDVEVELVAVIGTRLRDATPEQAMEGVFGYCLGNDVSDREAQKADKQNYRAKSYDTFGPLGPYVDTDFRPRDQAIRLWRNDALQQDSRVNQLIFGVPQLLSQISHWQTLLPGDLIYTGTPPGVGAHRKPPVWLQDGDVVRCEIEGLGELTNRVSRP
jgi:2-keto-4-pentenoate hydratase/2-oxohepta-3-ene-1,7-dioic acid hydratase in catechol pathway